MPRSRGLFNLEGIAVFLHQRLLSVIFLKYKITELSKKSNVNVVFYVNDIASAWSSVEVQYLPVSVRSGRRSRVHEELHHFCRI